MSRAVLFVYFVKKSSSAGRLVITAKFPAVLGVTKRMHSFMTVFLQSNFHMSISHSSTYICCTHNDSDMVLRSMLVSTNGRHTLNFKGKFQRDVF